MAAEPLPSIAPAKRRRRRKRRGVGSSPTPPPVAPDRIVSVAFGPGADQFTATLSSALVSVQDPGLGMWALFDGDDPAQAVTAVKSDDEHVVFAFAVDVTAAIAWHVEDPSVWEWEDAGPMNEPFDGPLS
jgi:hypothetical protein